MNNTERMAELARTFPALEGVDGGSPFDPRKLERAAETLSSGGVHAVRFLLAVWNANVKWEVGPFEVVRAFWTWDSDHRAAFNWASDPWTA